MHLQQLQIETFVSEYIVLKGTIYGNLIFGFYLLSVKRRSLIMWSWIHNINIGPVLLAKINLINTKSRVWIISCIHINIGYNYSPMSLLNRRWRQGMDE